MNYGCMVDTTLLTIINWHGRNRQRCNRVNYCQFRNSLVFIRSPGVWQYGSQDDWRKCHEKNIFNFVAFLVLITW